MQGSSVKYIMGFCTAVCLICSVVVCTFAVSLKDKQEANKALERQRQVLSVAGLAEGDVKPSPEETARLFSENIVSQVVTLKSGEVDSEASKVAETFDQQKLAKDPATSEAAPKNWAGVARIPNQALVFLVLDSSDKTRVSKYILPIEGKGLWSTLYGYIALESDTNRIAGITFYQHGETPGLGGEVDNPRWKSKWPNRLAFGAADKPDTWKEPKIKVKKGTARSPQEDPHLVDGLSGATITSNGVTYLLGFWLGEAGFGPYLQKQREAGGRIQSAAYAPGREIP